MKYGIITHYDVHNHGAFLQLNALIKVLKENFNIDAYALQFEKNYDFADRNLKAKFSMSIKSVGFYLNYIFKRGLKIFIFNIKKKKLFDSFKKSENLIGPYYTDTENLNGIIIGSDEVFSLFTGPTPAFFGYALPSNNVFAYAGCFGTTTIKEIKEKHCEVFVGAGLNSMRGVAMRDQNSIAITKELTGRVADLVVDPVILYGYEKELSFHSNPNLPKFLLVYAYESRMNKKEEYQKILDYAHSNGLIVVCPGFYHGWADININTDPVELLKYFKYAECVVTDTFHGAVMSIINSREMAVKLRDNSNKLLNLLDEYGLSNRVIGEEWDINSIFATKQNNVFINQEIIRRRKDSMNYLSKMIKI